MANIDLNRDALNQSREELEQAKTIIYLQCNTLNEVAGILESGWRSQSSVQLQELVNETQSELRKVGDAMGDCAGELYKLMLKIQFADRLSEVGAMAFGGGNGDNGGGSR